MGVRRSKAPNRGFGLDFTRDRYAPHTGERHRDSHHETPRIGRRCDGQILFGDTGTDAMRDPVLAQELLKTVMSRALATTRDSQAWFDAGYLIESYKQAVHLREDRKPELRAWTAVDETIRIDGYNWVKKSMSMGLQDAEVEFAASLMTQGATASAHRAKAIAAAPKNSLLAKNLASSSFLF
jgi:hypothetical protein